MGKIKFQTFCGRLCSSGTLAAFPCCTWTFSSFMSILCYYANKTLWKKVPNLFIVFSKHSGFWTTLRLMIELLCCVTDYNGFLRVLYFSKTSSLAQIGFCIINSFLPFSVDGQLLFGEFIVCFAWTFLEKWWWLREFLPLTFLSKIICHLFKAQSKIDACCSLSFVCFFVIKSAIFPNSSYHSHNYVEIDLPTKLRNFGGEL